MILSIYCQNCQTIQERSFDNARVIGKDAWPSGGDPSVTHDCVMIGSRKVRCQNCDSTEVNLRQRTATTAQEVG